MQYQFHGNRLAIFFVVLAPAGLAPVPFLCADEFESPPIEYSKAAVDNCITRLEQQLERGETKFDYDDQLGYLKSLLAALEVPVESQMLVFSKTSLQRQRISPRAIYFNNEVYVGFCQSGDVLEISTVDPKLGTVFYTLDQYEQGLNVTELADRFAVERYLSPHSDIVALMVLEHQALVHNRLTKASYATRQALHYEASLNKATRSVNLEPLPNTGICRSSDGKLSA